MRIFFLVLYLLFAPAVCSSTTAPDLKTRIIVDGVANEYTADEWVLNSNTTFRELPGDSRWGEDNDIRGIAITWDRDYVYIAVTCAVYRSVLMAFVEHAPGGISGLQNAGALRRSLAFTGLKPNLIASVDGSRPEAAFVAASSFLPLKNVYDGSFRSRFFQTPEEGGALEMALPWTEIKPENGILKLLAVVTGGLGEGAVDAAPDPSSILENVQGALAYLDNSVTVPVDQDLDGAPDMGISPREVVSFDITPAAPEREGRFFELLVEKKIIEPDKSEGLDFRMIPGELTEALLLYLTCEVYSVDGKRVTTIFRDEPRLFLPRTKPPLDRWDGHNSNGEIVPGGIYVIHVSGGVARGAATHVARKPVVVVR